MRFAAVAMASSALMDWPWLSIRVNVFGALPEVRTHELLDAERRPPSHKQRRGALDLPVQQEWPPQLPHEGVLRPQQEPLLAHGAPSEGVVEQRPELEARVGVPWLGDRGRVRPAWAWQCLALVGAQEKSMESQRSLTPVCVLGRLGKVAQ